MNARLGAFPHGIEEYGREKLRHGDFDLRTNELIVGHLPEQLGGLLADLRCRRIAEQVEQVDNGALRQRFLDYLRV